jgi:hypothetical protein
MLIEIFFFYSSRYGQFLRRDSILLGGEDDLVVVITSTVWINSG